MKHQVLLDEFVCEIKIQESIEIELNKDVIADLLFRYKMIVIRSSDMTLLRYRMFLNNLGKPHYHVLQNFSVDGCPDVIKISNLINADGGNEGVLDGGTYWHCDMSYKSNVGFITSMLSKKEPSHGGFTQFIDMCDALNMLRKNVVLCSKLEKACGLPLEKIRVNHVFGNRRQLADPQQPGQKLTAQQKDGLTPVTHQLIYKHPLTGKASLYAIAGTAFSLVGVPPDLSLILLNELEDFILEHAQFYQHEYYAGDLVLWDNLQTLHRGYGITPSNNANDYRLLYRMNISYHETENAL
ncbi:TauD/TfdA family dioxygenase [Pantoea sp. CCBC3-3-1]|uniref:TauD/TfdA dioxygenase family protein n=1 Tax=Pantoea sp. CCBC3-3-1 TaxID=2490851 RepID=UPI0011BF9CE5|nr:TauD/TfdA family dioxygenase [Pantoea sp. CCBC3-3-1]